MGSGKEKIYWDTAPLLAWIKDEKRAPGQMEGLEDVVWLVEAKRIILFISALWRVEILDNTLKKPARDTLDLLFKRRHIREVSIDPQILKIAHDIRSAHHIKRPSSNSKTLSTPDCIHLATAIHYGAVEFHTFDGQLLGLSNDALISGMLIIRPSSKQLSIRLDP